MKNPDTLLDELDQDWVSSYIQMTGIKRADRVFSGVIGDSFFIFIGGRFSSEIDGIETIKTEHRVILSFDEGEIVDRVSDVVSDSLCEKINSKIGPVL